MSQETSKNKNGLGLCFKSLDWKVLSQNKICIAICGDQIGNQCGKNCAQWALERGPNLAPDVDVFRTRNINGKYYDVVVFNGDAIITVLHPASKIQNNLKSLFKTAHLSPREQEVVLLRQQDYSQKEICARLFISLPTLKTHLQNIRSKFADLKRNSTTLKIPHRLL